MKKINKQSPEESAKFLTYRHINRTLSESRGWGKFIFLTILFLIFNYLEDYKKYYLLSKTLTILTTVIFLFIFFLKVYLYNKKYLRLVDSLLTTYILIFFLNFEIMSLYIMEESETTMDFIIQILEMLSIMILNYIIVKKGLESTPFDIELSFFEKILALISSVCLGVLTFIVAVSSVLRVSSKFHTIIDQYFSIDLLSSIVCLGVLGFIPGIYIYSRIESITRNLLFVKYLENITKE